MKRGKGGSWNRKYNETKNNIKFENLRRKKLKYKQMFREKHR